MIKMFYDDNTAFSKMARFFRVDIKKLQTASINGEDLYSWIVTERMGETTEQEMRMYRRTVKELLRGLMYGVGPKNFKTVKIEVDLKKAEEMMCMYLIKFPEVGEFLGKKQEEISK